jgi:hypothetical protein
MKPLARAAVVTKLRDELVDRGSWAGETHLQKSLFFLQEGAGVPLDFDFILYKFGPFSFDLRDELSSYRAERLMGLRVDSPRYGPQLTTTKKGKELQERFPKTLGRFDPQIQAVADFVGPKGVGQLEKLGTALLFQRGDPTWTDDEVAEQIVAVKPHVNLRDGVKSSADVRLFLSQLPVLK